MQRQDPQLCVGFTASIIITLEAGGGMTLRMHLVSVCIMMKSAKSAKEQVTRVRACNYVKLKQGGISCQY